MSVYDFDKSTSHFHSLVRSMRLLATVARPTAFHTFLNGLATKGLLLRHYTQKIDCIEEHLPALWQQTVQLHGRIDKAVC